MDLNKKHVLITGGSRGIGLAIAKQCALKGCYLSLVSRKIPAHLTKDLLNLGARSVTCWDFDLSSRSDVEKLIQNIQNSQQPLDVLINNAGLLTGGLLEEQNIDSIDQMLEVNVHALIRLTHKVLPMMLKRKSGLIVNNASVAGKMFFPCSSTYSASKAAVIAFTESLRQELYGTGVKTLLMITPGVKTDMFDDITNLYGKNLDVSVLTSINAEQWAEKVVKSIETDEHTVGPTGLSWGGVFLSKYTPAIFERVVRTKFNRH